MWLLDFIRLITSHTFSKRKYLFTIKEVKFNKVGIHPWSYDILCQSNSQLRIKVLMKKWFNCIKQLWKPLVIHLPCMTFLQIASTVITTIHLLFKLLKWTYITQHILKETLHALGMSRYEICPEYIFLWLKLVKLKDIQNLDVGTLKNAITQLGWWQHPLLSMKERED